MVDGAETRGFVPFQQSEAYAAAARAMGARAVWLDVDGGRVLAVERGRLRLISRVCLDGAAGGQRRALRRLARWPGITLATPEAGVAGLGLIPLVTPMHHAVWRLEGDLRAGMAGKWRNRLVAAERGVRVRRGDAGTLDRLIAEEARQRAVRRYRALPGGFLRALEPGALRLWEWRQGGGMAAAMAFVVQDGTASYQLGWASGAARAAGAHGVMLARAAEALMADGVGWLDLGSVDSEAAPGLARFKLGTGARLKRLGATCLVLP